MVQNIHLLSCFDLSFFSSLCTFQGAFPNRSEPRSCGQPVYITKLHQYCQLLFLLFLKFFCSYKYCQVAPSQLGFCLLIILNLLNFGNCFFVNFLWTIHRFQNMLIIIFLATRYRLFPLYYLEKIFSFYW